MTAKHPSDVMAALRACHIPESTATKMIQRESFPIAWERALKYTAVGKGRVAEMWKLGLLTSNPTEEWDRIRGIDRELRRERAIVVRQLDLAAVNRQIAALDKKRQRLLTRKVNLETWLEENGKDSTKADATQKDAT